LMETPLASRSQTEEESRRAHTQAVWLALLVTFLWATSWVLIKIGLQEVPALTFAGLRYSLAFLCLLPLALRPASRARLRQIKRPEWLLLVLLGVVFYTLTQGAQFLSLVYLPAATASLVLSFTPILVGLLGIGLLQEKPTAVQWGGTLLFLLGVGFYFYPFDLPGTSAVGLVIAGLGLLANAAAALLGRKVNRSTHLDALQVTVISMGVGGGLLLLAGLVVEGLPHLSWQSWLVVLWLAVINSALAFTLWNFTLRSLAAYESSLINNTMLFQIAILAWIFLGEGLGAGEVLGLLLAGIGIMVVGWRGPKTRQPDS
jgi:drug/metabolite transporter (DMT)-like permease